jgi:hypothetical protein
MTMKNKNELLSRSYCIHPTRFGGYLKDRLLRVVEPTKVPSDMRDPFLVVGRQQSHSTFCLLQRHPTTTLLGRQMHAYVWD